MLVLKNQTFRRLLIALLTVLALATSGVYAQTCDVNTQKSLEQTQVSYFDKVTQGDNAVFSIRYPLIGTTYIISDNLGTTYSFTYTSGTDEYISINAGPVNTQRRFSLKAQNGTCVYQTGFNYTVTPATSLELVTRVEHERCGNGGAIRFTFVGPGANNNDYNFFIKKDTDATFDTSTPLPLTGAQSRPAGKYNIMARPKVGTGDIITPAIEIKNDRKELEYTAVAMPVTCASSNMGIKAEIKVDQWGNHSANYPVYYSLLDSSDNPIAGKQRQTSNIFTNLTPGTYKVKVEDFCGSSPTPQSVTLTYSNLTFTHLGLTSVREFSCDYADFNKLYLYGTGLTEADKSDSFPYPFTISFAITAPSGAVYSAAYTITDKTDLNTYMPKYAYGEALEVTNNLREYRIPKEYGVWTMTAQLTVCSNTTTIGTATSTLYNPIENARVVQTAGGNSPTACHKERLIITKKYRRDTSPILNTYLVIEQAPTNFKYAEAGFYQISTTNPLLSGKYLKPLVYDPWQDTEIVASDFIHTGDVFQFSLVDATCSSTRSSLMDTVTVTIASAAQPTDITIHNIASCKDATTEEAPYASMRIIKGSGSPIEKIQIVSYNGQTTGGIPSTTLSLPYTLTETDRADENNWYVRDLPAGSYTVVVTNICGGIVTKTPVLSGQTYTVTFAPGCIPMVVGKVNLAPTDDWRYTQSEYIIQHFNETTQKWDEWLYAGLPLNTPINRKVEDEGLGKEGKFRIIRRIQNLAGSYECVLVLQEREFGGDLKKPKLVGFGCGGGKYHIAVVPQGGTGPFSYTLLSKRPGGGSTPVPVNQTQAGNNFFINIDGTNPNTAYKFTITDSCPRTEDNEVTIANVQTPTIVAAKRYYCIGQSAKLTVPDLGPSVTIEWYRSDAPTTLVATGTTLSIASLTAADFAHTYSVKLKIPSQPAVETCISNAIAAYQFQQNMSYPSYTAPTATNTTVCLQGNAVYNYDLNNLFSNRPTVSGGVTTTIVDAAGVIAVPTNGIINLNQRALKGTHTFLYQILTPCGEMMTQATATLTVYTTFSPTVKTSIKVCNATVTLAEVKQLIIEGSPEVATLQPEFHWYNSYADALAKAPELGSSTVLTTPSGSTQHRYLRLQKANYCSDGVYTITVQGETSVTAKTLTNTGCDVTTIAQLKALVDPDDAANVIIYKNGVAQADGATVETNTGYTYAKNVYECVTSPAVLNFNLTPRTQAQDEQAKVCTYIGYYSGLITKPIDVKDALMAKYPAATAIRIFDKDKNEYTNLYGEIGLETRLYFKIKEAGKCESIFYSVVPTMSATTEVNTHSITICEEITVGELINELQTTYSYTNVQIHEGRGTAVKPVTDFVDWNSSIYFSAQETGKCRSTKVPLILIKNTNVTTATAKTFEVCRMPSETPKVSDLKSVITGGDVRIFIRNNQNKWVLQADTDNVNTSYSYFYTLQAAGKCPSEKTPLIVNLLDRPTATPTVSATVTLCPTAASNVVSLDTYVAPLAAHTLHWYATATATTTSTTPTIDTHVTTKTTVSGYVVYVNSNGCESPRAVVTVTVDDTETPTLTLPDALVVDCRNATASITTWLNSATATDSCGVVSVTNNYNSVKPADLCNNSGVVTVTFTATDLFGNAVSETRTITLAHIKANTDSVTIANGANGGSTTITVFDNDKIGTQTATASTVSMTVVTPATGATGSATPTLNADGTVTVPAGTKSGTYTIGYKICAEVVSLTVCDSATVTVVVGQATITAVGDTFTVTNGANGGAAGNVLTNDKYNGTTDLRGNASVTLTWGTLPVGVVTTTNAGELKVNAGTASGTYTVTYTICEVLNNNNCSTQTATIVVGQATITAEADTFTVTNGANGGVAGNVLENDKYNGTTDLRGNASVTLTWGTLPVGVVTTTNAGELKVNAGTASGTYTVTYTICEVLNNNNCSTQTATIVVGQATITAEADTFTVTNGANGGVAGNVLTNDEYNGTTGLVGNASVTLTWLTVPAGIQTATNGDLSVAAGTASGTYEVTYKLCENLNGGNCSTATATIVVGQATITARNNDFVISNGANGGTTSNVLTDDVYNGTIGLVGNASITFTWNTVPTGIVANASGTVTVPAGTASGTYVLTYTICENLIGNNNCSLATVTVAVGVPLIRAYNDDDSTFHITNGANGGTTSSVLANDNLNGVTNPSINSVTLTWTNVPAGIQTNTNGSLTVPAGTPAGTYTVSYRICERLNGSNCSSATVTVVVGQATLTAVDDSFTVTNTTTTTTDSVLNNDSYNGTTGLVGNTSVTLTWLTVPAGIQTNTNGSLTVPAGIASGTYAVTYRLCEVLNNSNCSVATATIVVKGVATPTVTPTITANADTYTHTVSSTTYTTTSNVLTNDLIGTNSATVASVTIQTATPTTNSPYIDKNTGFVVIPSGTTTGTHVLTYSLCGIAPLTGCSSVTTVTVNVVSTTAAPINIVATPDGTVTISTATGGTTSSVLANDTLEGLPVTTGTVSFTWTTATPTGFTLNNDGTITVASNTAVGFYTVSYTICATRGIDRACATSFIEVRVVSPTVTDTIEVNGETFTYTGTQLVGNVLTNEKLNGVINPSVNSVTISATTLSGTAPFIKLSTGEVMVPPHTPAGTYVIDYRVSVKGNANVYGTASVVVIVPATPTSTVAPIAADDKVETARNTPVTIDVLANDTPNGATAPTVVTAPLNGTAVVNTDGTIEYTPRTGFKGVDTLVYELCNAGGCATATVSIEVTHKLIAYNGVSVNGSEKNNHFHIAGIEAYPDNTVRIYNRWGVKVFEVQHYDNVRNVFKGISEGRVTVEAADKLPQGTYYYVIEYVDENNQKQTMVGWLYLKK
ncbi:gliding motility-associated C-terminal domain-containing protein [Capnocytophaga leadbetteri]|uniref:T9SS type B sorting domain-containing protein n=1 Tax=Capnocytophaga leadbetteri TaxID=327575 RepID=UPI0026F353B6|nr:gliding motility-associated C-terminal domain-containing protein [Capnocytophaga leadbetteri]